MGALFWLITITLCTTATLAFLCLPRGKKTTKRSSHIPIFVRDRKASPDYVTSHASSRVDAGNALQLDDDDNDKAIMTPMEAFQRHNAARIAKADQEFSYTSLDTVTNTTTTSQEAHMNGLLDASISYSKLRRLGSSLNGCGYNDDSKEEVRSLYRSVESSGGYLIVELEEEDEIDLVDAMWATMQKFYDVVERGVDDDGDDDVELHHQELTRDNNIDDDGDPKTGYYFIQTYLDHNMNDTVQPTTIQDVLMQRTARTTTTTNTHGTHHSADKVIQETYHFFADLSEIVGTILAAGALNSTFQEASKIVKELLDDSDATTYYSTSNHRLCQYIPVQNQGVEDGNGENDDDNYHAESLRSHTDWTLTTAIPLSEIPGLFLWNPILSQWVSPEQAVAASAFASKKTALHSKYVVVLVGKWLELLTQQRATSCIHRVVVGAPTPPPSYRHQSLAHNDSSTRRRRRLSAPFFLRPKESTMIRLQEGYGKKMPVMAYSEAMAKLYEMFD